MLDDEGGLHAELCAFFDGEGFRFEGLDGARGRQVDGDVGAGVDFEGEGSDDAAALVFGVDGDGGRGGDAEGGFPAVEGFVVLVWQGIGVRKEVFFFSKCGCEMFFSGGRRMRDEGKKNSSG